DEELARLHDELSDTVVGYGGKGAATRAAVAAAAAAPVSVKAARAGFLSAKKDESETLDDLVGGVASGRVDIAKVPAADLPRSLADLTPEARKEKVAEKTRARADVLDRIAKASAERDAYLKKSPTKPTGFDGEVENTLRKAGASAGLMF
ncbi:MAG TPA: hypothetical protein VK989_17940, partial [Polyangia bacterium]|nr:hypothetical protein [Polyangia bacterium]